MKYNDLKMQKKHLKKIIIVSSKKYITILHYKYY